MRSFARRVCVWERERERGSQWSVQSVRNHLNRGLCANTYEHHHCVRHANLFSSRAWTDGKTKDIINCLYFTLILKAEAHDYGKGRYISDAACGVRPITMHCASWPIRADCACRKEGLCRKRCVRERRGTIMYSIWKIMCFLNIKACQHILLHQIHKIMIFKKSIIWPL